MVPPWNMVLAFVVLAIHVAVIAFNLFGVVVIPIGARRGWAFVRVAWWRVLHVAALGIVAGQALAGRDCFLTLWQDALMGARANQPPLIMRWVNAVIFWPLPPMVFAAAYAVVFVYVLTLLWLVPPRWRQ